MDVVEYLSRDTEGSLGKRVVLAWHQPVDVELEAKTSFV